MKKHVSLITSALHAKKRFTHHFCDSPSPSTMIGSPDSKTLCDWAAMRGEAGSSGLWVWRLKNTFSSSGSAGSVDFQDKRRRDAFSLCCCAATLRSLAFCYRHFKYFVWHLAKFNFTIAMQNEANELHATFWDCPENTLHVGDFVMLSHVII